MRRRINRQLIITSILATLVTMILMVLVSWQLLLNQVVEDLKSYAVLLEDTELYKEKELYDDELKDGELRVTWIDPEGYVLDDTNADQALMGNHGLRPEVLKALEKGEGYDIRTSETMEESTYYYAMQLQDGTVLRVSKNTSSVWNILLKALPGMVLALIIMIGVCILMARVFARSIMRPLKELARNLDHPDSASGYKELDPFMQTIRTQHENILRAARMRQDFTANVSHELKTPLTAISGYSELIETGMVQGEEVQQFAREIHHNSNRLLSLINDIIHLSEMDRTEYEVAMQQENLSELARACVQNLEVSGQKRNVTLRYSGEEALVYGNKELLEELLWNLCDNAIRYNVEGGTVNVQVQNREDTVELSVKDTGIGISKEHQDRVFERFYRVDKSRSKETGGTGLGLAIVKHIVAQHDAELILESEPGKGTIIRVLFPVQR